MIAKLAGVALDARWAVFGVGELAARANAARWIAANALAASDVRLISIGHVPPGPRLYALHVDCFAGALAALATVPALLDPRTIPRGWRLALRALGVPMLEVSPLLAFARGASVMSCEPAACEVSVEPDLAGYRVHIAAPDRTLAA